MPFIELLDEGVSMFYRSNLPGDGSVDYLDRTRQTLLLLSGTILDSSDMHQLLNDPCLTSCYNMIALDARSVGQTVNGPNPARDDWTDAADIVKALETLQIQAVYVFACSGRSVAAALRMVLLWPEKCLSLTLLAIQGQEDPAWVTESWSELVGAFLSADSLETMEEVLNEIFPFAFGEWLSDEQKDVLAEYWELQYPPTRASRFYDFAAPRIKPEPLSPDVYALIRAPVLILNGDETIISSPKEAAELQEALVNSSGGAKLHIIADAPDQLHYLARFSGTVVEHLFHFLETLPPTPAPISPMGDSMERALCTLSDIKGDPTIAKRDPRLSTSFSCVSAAVREERTATFKQIAASEKTAFSPLGPNGELPRKFSDRSNEKSSRDAAHKRQSRLSQSNMCGAGVEVLVSKETDRVHHFP